MMTGKSRCSVNVEESLLSLQFNERIGRDRMVSLDVMWKQETACYPESFTQEFWENKQFAYFTSMLAL
jgi:hypothetical protein